MVLPVTAAVCSSRISKAQSRGGGRYGVGIDVCGFRGDMPEGLQKQIGKALRVVHRKEMESDSER